ncbi:NAD(P)-dependent oxidoreductase [Clostridium botulinum]|uniref:NAD-dependent epimerase/dehydratase family protein n=1 Tax=Clostridium botulinum TaxID=1491 RepID=UPI001C9B590B|nr:NAD-dependent epimerase/dehydratase family protein [Clostridium botulinum]MBY6811415.1 NAD-dependent epimerase/dehydratase family protein [Clostridium botulinum]MBY6824834.1 NAD-dependent epimerase/dehydratase family protein [Clostridium botulinum]MBY6835228.1 NAD-dependent epimerase/dehydratase family protein [Clostridium botulinum]MBY6973741.1 NAD-dependent epimerase/dehydratase family protein [Clostridium botulinum]HBJ1651644.1 NAD-dependent epimerase/dehydratase family protein [Clostrid
MYLINNNLYREDITKVASLSFPWEKLKNKSIMISGSTGMIGSFLIDLIMHKNENQKLNCEIYALGRNENKARKRFELFWNSQLFNFIELDINKKIELDKESIDYIFHAASNTHPVAYATDPIGTVTTNIIGTNNLLEFCALHNTKRFIFASSVEIYGENRGDVEEFNEEYYGYINSNTLRAGYPESKRAGEALCQAYIKQKGIDVVIPRLSRTFGPTMLMSDTKAISQFIKKGVINEDIVLKSKGTQFYSYNYISDAVSGILACLFWGKTGEAYNIADDSCNISLRDIAEIIADFSGKNIIFEIPDEVESAGYSKATKAVLDSEKLQNLGWKAMYDIKDGLIRTIEILRCIS